jgi:hypothetical protein
MLQKQKIAIAGTSTLILSAGIWFWVRTSTGRRIIRIAKGFVGQKEIPDNAGFYNPVFQSMMSMLGAWVPGAEWCASFVRMVWLSVLKGKRKTIAKKLLSPSTQTTFTNFQKDTSGLFTVSSKPKTGSVVIWRARSNPAKGHAGIYVGKIAGKHYFVEGNKGNAVRLTSYTDYSNPTSNLYFRGFINIR